MNRRYMLPFAAALLAAGAPLHAQADDQPPAPPAAPTLARPLPPPPPTQALLRYKFAVGQVIRYQTVADVNMRITMPNKQHQTILIVQHVEAITRTTVKSVNPAKDTATMTVQVESMKGTTNGQPTPQSAAQKAQIGAPTTLTLSSTGQVVAVKLNAASKVPGFDPSKMNFSQQNGALPIREVKPGDTWTSAINMSSIGAKVASNFQLTALTPSDSGIIAQIQQNASGTIRSTGASALPAGLKIGGRIAVSGQTQFDVNAGSIKSQSTSDHFDATVNAPSAVTNPVTKKSAHKIAAPASSAPTKIHVDSSTVMTRLDGDAAPPEPATPTRAPAAPGAL